MLEFLSFHAYRDFERSVKRKARFVHDEQVREFLQTVLETSKSRMRRLPKDGILFRAQMGYTLRPEKFEGIEEEIELPRVHPESRMIPTPKHLSDGRVNPAGIPVLYLANSETAAMAEVRPWVGRYVSLAQFKVMRDCALVDCSLDKERGFDMAFEIPPRRDSASYEAGVWGDIAHAFSEPVAIDEPHLDYLPTQILAEAFRSHGYDGIAYRSMLHENGKNFALFDVTAAELINCGLYETKSVAFEFDQADNPYFVTGHYPELAESRTSDEDPRAPEEK